MNNPPLLVKTLTVLAGPILFFTAAVLAQAPTGPITPRPGATIQSAPAQSKIVRRVSLVNTPVTVKDASGQMINSLDVKDFQVTDNGIPQQITHFDLGGDSLSIVFLVETSSRIAPLMPQINKAGIVLAVTVMGTNGEAAVVGFNDSVDKLQDFTTNQDAVEKTIGSLHAVTDGSKLFDAMAIGVEMLSGRPQPAPDTPGRRRVMVILSEATDAGSQTKLGAVLRQAQLSNVAIYSVGLSTTMAEWKAPAKDTTPQPSPPGTFTRAPFPGSVQTPGSESALYGGGDLMAVAAWAVQHIKNKITDHALELAATATGGEHIATFKNHSIENAVDEIGGELHSQYSLSYVPSGTDQAGYHEIKVAVKKEGLKVRARPGYYLAGPES
ncbi:MAG TPA: VWA domain-containing protein [Candidatus Acidoferrum sp.]|nr:VWA domain-containing protein [Candidatus Acidoferrum sp.]